MSHPDPKNVPLQDVCVVDVHGFNPRVVQHTPRQECLAAGGLYRGVTNLYTIQDELVGFHLQTGCTDRHAPNYDTTALLDNGKCSMRQQRH